MTKYRNNVPISRREKHDIYLNILHQAGPDTSRQAATLAKRHALTIALHPRLDVFSHTLFLIYEEQAVRGSARNKRRYTGLNLNSTKPTKTWSPSHIEKGEKCCFSDNPTWEQRGLSPGRMHDWRGSHPIPFSSLSATDWKQYIWPSQMLQSLLLVSVLAFTSLSCNSRHVGNRDSPVVPTWSGSAPPPGNPACVNIQASRGVARTLCPANRRIRGISQNFWSNKISGSLRDQKHSRLDFPGDSFCVSKLA